MNSIPYELNVTAVSPTIQAIARFPAEFLAFQGHFPGRPILPGFMHVQLALDVLSTAGLAHDLREIAAAKFSRAILPDQCVSVIVAATEIANRYDVTLDSGNETCSTFTLAVA